MRRGLLALVAGLILTGIPVENARGQKAETRGNQAHTATPQPQDYYSPCGRNEENRHSDLCAQWRSNDWARRSYRIGLIGVIGLIFTLIFNLEAWRQARKGKADTAAAIKAAQENAAAATKLANTADRTARAELRAYLDFDGVHILRCPKRDKPDFPDTLAAKCAVCIKNYGKTPAENLEVHTTCYVVTENGERIKFTVDDRIDFDSVAPGDHVTHHAFWDNVPKYVWAAYETSKIKIIVALVVTYTNVFREKPHHILRAEFETFECGQDLGFVRGTRKAT